MAWYHRRTLHNISTKIRDSLKQLEEYLSKEHAIGFEWIHNIGTNIETIDIPHNVGILDNTMNIVVELKKVMILEEKRRMKERELEQSEKRGAIKKRRIEKRKRNMKKKANPYRMAGSQSSSSNEFELEAPASGT